MSKKVLDAVTQTLHAYEALIAHTYIEREKWINDHNCRICKAMGNKSCDKCPIHSDFESCAWGQYNEYTGSKYKVITYCKDYSFANHELKCAARERYKELLRRLELNGYEYK